MKITFNITKKESGNPEIVKLITEVCRLIKKYKKKEVILTLVKKKGLSTWLDESKVLYYIQKGTLWIELFYFKEPSSFLTQVIAKFCAIVQCRVIT